MQNRFNARRLHLRLQAALVALAGMAASPLVLAQASAGTPFTIGVLPNVSVRVLFASYQPMREYFERDFHPLKRDCMDLARRYLVDAGLEAA